MTLKQDIDAFVAQAASRMPTDLVAEVQASIDDAKRSGIEARARKAGDSAPAFTLPNAHGALVSLADFVHSGPVILVFYRGVWCPYCNLELRAYQQILGEIRAAGGDLVAISPQTPDNSLASIGTNGLEFEVLSDAGAEVAAAFGLAYPVPAAVRRTTAMFGVDIDQVNGAADSRLPITAAYVIGMDRRIALASVDADFRVRLEPAEALAALRALSAARPTLAAE
jgi:peroxiredoxin